MEFVSASTGLRPYQRELLRKVLAALEITDRPIMMQLPTGGGKTVIAAHLLRDYLTGRRKAVWLTHRKELASQTERMLTEAGILATTDARWVPGERAPSIANSVVILMAQTVGLRTKAAGVWSSYYKNDLLIIDEAHHATAPGWERAIRQWPGKVLGMTATPWRLSKKEGFDHLFGDLILGPQVSELQNDEFLCETQVLVPRDEDRILGGEIDIIGDYTERGIEEANTNAVMTAGALDFWQEQAEGRPTIIYAVSVGHAKNLAAVFNGAGVDAGLILGDTAASHRSNSIESFRTGKLQVLVNVVVATEGFDLPDASCIVIARPTKSLSLYLQMIGRGLRPKENGNDCLILDLAGNALEHGLPEDNREWSLLPRGIQLSDGAAPVVWCKLCKRVSSVSSQSCKWCGTPFGKNCQRCGKWRAWKRWSRLVTCPYPHDEVCDLCHDDAHLEAHLPTIDSTKNAPAKYNTEAKTIVDPNDLDKKLALLLQELLEQEKERMSTQALAEQNELSESIDREERDLRDDHLLEIQFESYIAKLSSERKPETQIQRYRMFTKWESEKRKTLASLKDSLEELKVPTIDDPVVIEAVRQRLNIALTHEANNMGFSTGAAKATTHSHRGKRRSGKGDRLDADKYTKPILLALLAMGGEGRARDVIKQVGDRLLNKFMPGDLVKTSSGKLVWKKRIQTTYPKLQRYGHLETNSPWGVWRLTSKGREMAENYDQNHPDGG